MLHEIPDNVIREARREVRRKQCHWYVRQQAALLLGARILSARELLGILRQYKVEQHVEVKRAWIPALAQLKRDELTEVARNLVFSVHPKLQQVGRLLHGLLFNADEAKQRCASIFRNHREEVIFDRLFEVEVIAKNNDPNVQQVLCDKLKHACRHTKHPSLSERLTRIRSNLQCPTRRHNPSQSSDSLLPPTQP
jgi:hypothetical protein